MHIKMRACWKTIIVFSSVMAMAFVCSTSAAAQKDAGYVISTYKNGAKVGSRKVTATELRNASIGLVDAFQAGRPDYQILLKAAKSMTAMDRCFQWFVAGIAMASIQSGALDASANAENFLQDSKESIGETNTATRVTCDMR